MCVSVHDKFSLWKEKVEHSIYNVNVIYACGEFQVLYSFLLHYRYTDTQKMHIQVV